jgi:hypothetical protein
MLQDRRELVEVCLRFKPAGGTLYYYLGLAGDKPNEAACFD